MYVAGRGTLANTDGTLKERQTSYSAGGYNVDMEELKGMYVVKAGIRTD